MLVLVALPLSVVFAEAFSKGVSSYFAALSEPNALSAIRLTLLVAAIAVPFNVVFGVVASWAITKFEFVGKRLLITFIDLPFSVSPIISGLIYVLLFGAHGFMGEWLYEHVWRPGDLLVWDNRCSMHARTDFPAGERRLMLRTTVEGEVKPF